MMVPNFYLENSGQGDGVHAWNDLPKGIYIIGYFYKNTLVKSDKIILTK